MAWAFPLNSDGSPAVVGMDHTSDALFQWITTQLTGFLSGDAVEAAESSAVSTAAQITINVTGS
jgi:hypothetical protein